MNLIASAGQRVRQRELHKCLARLWVSALVRVNGQDHLLSVLGPPRILHRLSKPQIVPRCIHEINKRPVIGLQELLDDPLPFLRRICDRLCLGRIVGAPICGSAVLCDGAISRGFCAQLGLEEQKFLTRIISPGKANLFALVFLVLPLCCGGLDLSIYGFVLLSALRAPAHVLSKQDNAKRGHVHMGRLVFEEMSASTAEPGALRLLIHSNERPTVLLRGLSGLRKLLGAVLAPPLFCLLQRHLYLVVIFASEEKQRFVAAGTEPGNVGCQLALVCSGDLLCG